MDKKHLRRMIKEDLNDLDEQAYLEKSKLVSKNLLSLLPEIISKHCIETLKLGVYSPFQKEPIWFSEFVDHESNYLLVHMKNDSNLSFHPMDLKTIKTRGMSLELNENERAQVEIPNVVLIPGLAFTTNGQRLGRGKGYFDRYLEDSQSIKVGICFDLQIQADVFAESHDSEMDYLVTETNIYRRGTI